MKRKAETTGDSHTVKRGKGPPDSAVKNKWSKREYPPKQPQTNEKKDWNKLKQDKKDLKIKRKERRAKNEDIFKLTAQAKKIYEKLKCKTEANRTSLALELHNLLKNSNIYSKMVLAHDTARVIQCLFKVAPNETKAEILKELLPSVPQMTSSKYSHFCIAAVLKHGTSDMRDQVINSLQGHIVKLTSHNLASSTVDSIYVTWASNKQRAFMKQEFYSDLYKRDKDSNIKSIGDCFKVNVHMKNVVLNNLKQHIIHLANKKLVDNSLVHALMLEFLGECNEADRNEVCNLFNSQLASLASTKDGAKVASQIFFLSATKERRAALKALKDHVQKICVHEFGYYLVLAILNTLDDTKLLKKYILDVIVENLEEIAKFEWGRKIIEWIVLPGDKSMFHPQFTADLNKGLINSKKDSDIRQTEILEATEISILEAITKRPDFWISNGHIGLTTASILKKSTKNELLTEAFEGLAKVIANPDWEVQIGSMQNAAVQKEEDPNAPKKFKKKKNPIEEEQKKDIVVKTELGIESAGLHIALKKLAKEDEERYKDNRPTFCDAVIQNITSETIEKWTGINRGCFFLVNLFENASEESKSQLIGKVKPLQSNLKSQKSSGAKVLIDKMK